MILFEGLFTPRGQVSVDDGGVRCATPAGGFYVPFASLADAAVEFSALGVALLRLVARDGSRTTVRITRGDALEVQSDILHHITHQPPPSDATRGASTIPTFARKGRPLLEWFADVAAWAQSSGGYRSAALDHATAKATLLDASAPAELRAACVHAMLATGDEEDLAAVAKVFVGTAVPPLVVIAARLGRGGAALVPDEMCQDVLRFLPAADGDAARSAIAAPVTHENEAHVREVMERVKKAAIAEAAAKRSEDTHRWRRKKHIAHPLGFAGEQGVTRFK